MNKQEKEQKREIRKEEKHLKQEEKVNKKQERKRKKLLNTSRLAKLIFDFDDNAKACVTNKYRSSNKIYELKDVVYHPEEAEICKLDFYRPELIANVNLPVIVNVHGGGWVTGDKKWRVAQGKLFADMGACVVNVNYGLSPAYKYHESLRHIFLAFNWLEANAEKYKLDLANVFLMGDSAGGQIACQICATVHNKDFLARLGVEPIGISIKGAILNCGAYDFEELSKNPMAGDIIKDMIGMDIDLIEQYEYKDMLYTIPWIEEDFPKRVFVAYGKNDLFVGKHHVALLKKLDELGKSYVTFRGTFPGFHCFHLFYKTRESRKMYMQVKKYLMEEVRASN